MPYYAGMTKKTDKKRNHDRASGKAQTSISLRTEILEAAKAAAEADNRSLSNWLEILLKEKLGGQHPKSESSEGDRVHVCFGPKRTITPYSMGWDIHGPTRKISPTSPAAGEFKRERTGLVGVEINKKEKR